MKPIVKAKKLNFVYNKGRDNEFHALINVDVEIYEQEFVIIFGPSGCGKSTLLNVIAGLEKPDNGSVFSRDRDLVKMDAADFAQYHRKEVGMIYQAYNLITTLTVLDNVALPQIFLDMPKNKREKKSMDLLERFGIQEHAHKIPTELSGGQQQRIGIARAIVNDPMMILADEPIGNLDSVSAQNVLEIMQDLNKKEKRTIIMVTHNPEYLNYGDRIIYMKDGRITKESINRHKTSVKKEVVEGAEEKYGEKGPQTQLEKIMQAYEGLKSDQLNILIMPFKATAFAHHFLSDRNLDEIKIFENIMQKKLMNSIEKKEFFNILNRPFREGGVGLDKRTAEKLIDRINKIMKVSYFLAKGENISKEGESVKKSSKATEQEKAKSLTSYLLEDSYKKHFTKLPNSKTERIEKAVLDRLVGLKDKNQFFEFLDLSFQKGGAGLNSKMARSIAEEMELILITVYGIKPN